MFGSDRSHRTASAPLALRNIDDNLCFTRNEAWAWFVLPTGDLGILTEGERGMLHSEWNNTDVLWIDAATFSSAAYGFSVARSSL